MATVWKFGLGMGVLTCLYLLGEFWLGFQGSDLAIGRYTWVIGLLIPIVGLFLGIKSYRDDELGGMLELGQAFRAGMGMTLILAFLTASFFTVYATLINPGVGERYVEMTRDSLEKAGAPAEEIERQVVAVRESQTPFRQFTLTLGRNLAFGAVVSVVSGLLLRRVW